MDSKKIRVWALSLVLIVAQFVAIQLGVKVSPETWTMFFSILGVNGAYIIGQGIADNGKEAKKLEIAAKEVKETK